MSLGREILALDSRILELQEELDGLREQNAKLTEALQAAARPRMHSEECDEHLIQLERDLAHAAAANAKLTEAIQVAESDRDHAISFQAANTSRCEYLEDQIQRLEAIIGGDNC
jgi:chromosome segregation ATPase